MCPSGTVDRILGDFVTGGGRINEVIRIKHVRRIKHAFEKWVFCFFLRRIKHVRVLFDFLNFSCVVTR